MIYPSKLYLQIDEARAYINSSKTSNGLSYEISNSFFFQEKPPKVAKKTLISLQTSLEFFPLQFLRKISHSREGLPGTQNHRLEAGTR